MKKVIGIIISVLILLGIVGGIYYYLNKEDSDSTLTILEKQWIENNKNTIQDFAIVNKIPVFTLDGEGVFYEFMKEIEEKTGLEFNEMTYAYRSDIPSKYALEIKDKIEKNDILVYQDNYVLLSNENEKYLNLENIDNKKIGVLESDLDNAKFYLNNSNTLTFITYETVDELIEEIKNEETELSFIILPRLMYLNEILENDLNINYNITEMQMNYVITLGENETLNKIINKYFNKWSNESYSKSYNNNFSKNYYELVSINNDSEVNFQSKQYVYGFVNNEPYDKLVNNKLLGINSNILKSFSEMANIEIIYKEYSTYTELISAMNKGEIDLFMNFTDKNKFETENYSTVEVFDDKTVVLTHNENDMIINSINSLINSTVLSVNDSNITKYLTDNKIKCKTYKTIDSLLDKITKKTIIVIDYKTYEMYSKTILKDYIVKYTFNTNKKYSYIVKKEGNEVLYKYFDFYLSYENVKRIIDKVSYKEFEIEKNNQLLKNLIVILSSIFVLVFIGVIAKVIKLSKKKNQGITKVNKLKYIDMLTSLKNRTYLNEHIEVWDDSGIYPQSIMIVDLNNIAYINDNYGHEEGDNVITEAANILIKNQLEQTEIIRTSGNEFLIYLVGYEEKQIVAYKRKLIKECKELAHGFGAAVGYSMILDGLKTIDDAINEATLDMRANKEETE